ncbi:hypothetical protein Sjap_014440 [Stephania japonica]|uniref:Uncharacterized protein n=1 Tax=Stephania japonica TaxID=461633 RepID=A0AAP0NQF1_9MAGN
MTFIKKRSLHLDKLRRGLRPEIRGIVAALEHQIYERATANAFHYESAMINDSRIKIAPAVPQTHNQGQSNENGGFFKRPQDKRCRTDNYQVHTASGGPFHRPAVTSAVMTTFVAPTTSVGGSVKSSNVPQRSGRQGNTHFGQKLDSTKQMPQTVAWQCCGHARHHVAGLGNLGPLQMTGGLVLGEMAGVIREDLEEELHDVA